MSKSHDSPARSRARLPPLGALRAFDAVARHGSVSRAARELNVTQGAVSRQLALLQSTLRVQLVARTGRGVALTEHGQRLFTGVNAAFGRLRDSIEEFEADAGRATVTITTLQTVATRWLIPRIGSFQQQNPGITLDVRTSPALADLADATFDLAIRFGDGKWPGVKAQCLFEVKQFPVCSPEFLDRHGPVRGPSDLAGLPLIHKMSRRWWLEWLQAAGVRPVNVNGGVIVDEYELAIQLAVDGQGVALARDALIDQELRNGALRRVFDAGVALPRAFYLCHAEARPLSRAARRVHAWLVDAARAQGID